MKIDAHGLDRYIRNNQQKLPAVWLVSGNEPLLVQEAVDRIRQEASSQGLSERLALHVEEGFDWREFLQEVNSVDMFSDKRLFELRFKSDALKKAAAENLVQAISEAGASAFMTLIMPKLGAGALKSTWYRKLMRHGVHLPVWPVSLQDMPAWLNSRLKKAELALTPEAVQFMLSRIEGNLLAADQEITKLSLLDSKQVWTPEEIAKVVGDSSKYTLSDLVETALAGHLKRALKILTTLEHEGVFPLMILAALNREMIHLHRIRQAVDAGHSIDSAISKQGVFRRRIPATKKAVSRLSTAQCEALLARMTWVDQSTKGVLTENPWAILRNLILGLTGHLRLTANLSEASQQLQTHWKIG